GGPPRPLTLEFAAMKAECVSQSSLSCTPFCTPFAACLLRSVLLPTRCTLYPPHPEERPKAASRRMGRPHRQDRGPRGSRRVASQPSMRRLRKLACPAPLLTTRR